MGVVKWCRCSLATVIVDTEKKVSPTISSWVRGKWLLFSHYVRAAEWVWRLIELFIGACL